MTIHLWVTYWVYKSANDNGMNAFGWAAFYFFTGPIGFVSFIAARVISSIGVAGDTVIADPRRKRVVDQRRDFSKPDSIEEILPIIPPRFHDDTLKELLYLEEWDNAMAHVEEMISLARADGKERLAGDYRRMQFWIQEKRNPFKKH